jgi:hypothetical protein
VRPLCTNVIARPDVRMPDTPCGRVMLEVGETAKRQLMVYACPRCDAATGMPSRSGRKQ